MLRTAELRRRVVLEARAWLATPYHHHGRVRGAGVDCANLLCAVFGAAGAVGDIQPGFYPTDWHLHRNEEMFLAWLARAGAHRIGQPPQPGDIAVYRFGRCFSHGAVVVDEQPALIHAYIGLGTILTRADEEPLCGRDVQYWSLW